MIAVAADDLAPTDKFSIKSVRNQDKSITAQQLADFAGINATTISGGPWTNSAGVVQLVSEANNTDNPLVYQEMDTDSRPTSHIEAFKWVLTYNDTNLFFDSATAVFRNELVGSEYDSPGDEGGAIGVIAQAVGQTDDGSLLPGESVGLYAKASAYQTTQYGTISKATPVLNGQTNVGSASVVYENGSSGVFVGHYVQIASGAAGPTEAHVSSVQVLDNRDTGLPVLIARTNQTQVFGIDGSGSLSMTGGFSQTVYDLGSGTSIDPSLHTWFSRTLTADTTFTFANLANGQEWSVAVIQDASHTVTWPTVTWMPSVAAPTMDTGAGIVNVFTFKRIAGVTYGDVSQRTASSNVDNWVASGTTNSSLYGIGFANGYQVTNTLTLLNAANIVAGTSTGSKIGTATSQKLGFFNATPIIQPVGATDTRATLINLGLLASGGASQQSPIVNIYTNLGTSTWTNVTGAVAVRVYLVGGGGGGGSGRKGLTNTVRCGGGGGAGGNWSYMEFPAALLGSTETVTVGGGGPGGASQTVNSSNGSAGNTGTNTTFGSWLRASGGGGGGAGTTATGSAGSAGSSGGTAGGAGGTASTTGLLGASGAGGLINSGGGGGSGGGLTTADATSTGGNGGSAGASIITGGSGSTSNGSNGGNVVAGLAYGGSGGGAGGSKIASTPAGSGATGGNYGGGGGGSGAGQDSVGATISVDSGTAGTGGGGICVIITSF